MKPRALISVTDKAGVREFARGLVQRGFEVISTGGTAKDIRDAGVPVTDVAEVTGFPEMLDGRVKTLHPMVHGGLLGDVRLASHQQQMENAGIRPISVLAVNLYAFEKTVTGKHDLEQAIESIDIGGPAMIRAAAKNWANVAVVVDPSDYLAVLEAIDRGTLGELRLKLCAKAFRHTAFCDSMIARYLTQAAGDSALAETLTIGQRKVKELRYGENPHQQGAVYVDPLGTPGVESATLHWGKELGYNNYLDAEAAWELVNDLPGTACAIIKHGNPCGVAIASTFGDAYRLAKQCDPVSAFGGVAAFNGRIDIGAAQAMVEKGNFLEVVVGTGFDPEALQAFKERSGWGQDVRLLSAEPPPSQAALTVRGLRGGWLVQETDEDPRGEWRVVTKAKPTPEQTAALRLQWILVQHIKSNAICVGDDKALFGVGAGQMNRVQSVRLALEQAGVRARGAVLASDAFFPFPDSVETAAQAGISAIVQPGGSKKDAEVIEAADRMGLAMCFTGVRHFRH